MSITVKVAFASFPSSSVTEIRCRPGLKGVSTVITAVKLPFELVVAGLGTVGITSPSHVTVSVELAENLPPIIVVAANPLSGIKTRYWSNSKKPWFTLWGI